MSVVEMGVEWRGEPHREVMYMCRFMYTQFSRCVIEMDFFFQVCKPHRGSDVHMSVDPQFTPGDVGYTGVLS